jgi:hypothetical protein
MPLATDPSYRFFAMIRDKAKDSAGSSILVGQACQPDIPDVRLESLTYERP